MRRALWIGGLCGLVGLGCSSNSASGGSGDGGGTTDDGGPGGPSVGTAKSLVGTWDLATTQTGSTEAIPTTVAIGQDSLTVTSPEFTLTAVRTGNTVAYSDMTDGVLVLDAAQTPAPFDAGILPFNLGGTWTMQILQATTIEETCTLAVSASEIDGACHMVAGGFDFSFTTAKMSSADSVLGDFGGKWMNEWTWTGTDGGPYPCELDFIGSGITTCPLSAADAAVVNRNILQGITFTYDGANTVSGTAQGWAEYSATR